MTALQYREALRRVGISQRSAAAFFGVDERTSRRWALGEVEIPGAVEKLLRLMISARLSPEEVDFAIKSGALPAE